MSSELRPLVEVLLFFCVWVCFCNTLHDIVFGKGNRGNLRYSGLATVATKKYEQFSKTKSRFCTKKIEI